MRRLGVVKKRERAGSISMGLLLCALVLSAGCKAPGDTGGLKPQEVLSQADAEKEIQKVKDDPHMPDFAKQMTINTIRQKAGMPTDAKAVPPGPGGATAPPGKP